MADKSYQHWSTPESDSPVTSNYNMKRNQSQLLIATHNPGKIREFKTLLAECTLELISLAELGITDEPPETGHTFEDNAIIKANFYLNKSSMITLSEDSGLEVDVLDGAPGVYSSRYGGPGLDDKGRNLLLLNELIKVGKGPWECRYRSVIAIAIPNENLKIFDGECHGEIVDVPKGKNGFGYDPIFHCAVYRKTMAELLGRDKDMISHRGIATRKSLEYLNNISESLSAIQ